ncbi:ferredoxin reductase, partial [Escherichia coli]|nr:ferredoxin reductase [Escherichia coli]
MRQSMPGNTPVTHLSDGSLWDRQAFPDTTILEIRPRKRLKY